ncbi:molybdopterin molybdotransferase MoeA [Candidatus Pyrohabitans sp.]
MEKLVPLSRAREIVDTLRERLYFNRETEVAGVELQLIGRELAEDVLATEDSPGHAIASYDGYAMRSRDAERYPLRVVGSIYAGDAFEALPELHEGEAMYIATGAFLPPGADCVLRLEDARLEGDKLYGIPIEKGTKVVPQGSNYRRGEVILRAESRIRAQEFGILKGMGIEEVEVYRRPRVAVLATGNEIARGLLRDINSFVVMAMLEQWGCETTYLGVVEDDYEAMKQALLEASQRYDCVVTSGGVSVGRRDYVLRAIEEMGEVVLYKVKTRPGKPIAVGIINKTPIFALPGKPTGALVAAQLHLRRYFLGRIEEPFLYAGITEDILLSTKDTDAADIANLVFVHLENGYARPVGFEGSEMPLMKSGDKYNVSAIASNLRSALVDGYAIIERDTRRGEKIKVHFFT